MKIDLKLGEFAKPVDTLIREVPKGISTLSEEPLRRWNEKRDFIHAMNMCEIIEKARAEMEKPNAASLEIDSGFLLNFLDKCKTVSDADMQDLWSSILARESAPRKLLTTSNKLIREFRKTRC